MSNKHHEDKKQSDNYLDALQFLLKEITENASSNFLNVLYKLIMELGAKATWIVEY